mmetsp:Transcript_10138/g.23715  ORF Transcript_10138/g.23715 Transcript_10138/m.23715 type:complete len:608 (+) Transcript_10138:136-1959(+)
MRGWGMVPWRWSLVLCLMVGPHFIQRTEGQSLMCAPDHLCDYTKADGTIVHTPPSGSVLGASIDPSGFPTQIAFQVHYNSSIVSRIVVKYSDYAHRQATAATCPLPASFGTDPRENCSQTAVLSSDAATGITTSVVSVLPVSGGDLCFYGVRAADGASLPAERCVSIAPVGSAQLPNTINTAFVDNIQVPVRNRAIIALVGNKEGAVQNPHVLRIDLSTDPTAVSSGAVEIGLRTENGITSELPGQQWLGPTMNDNGVWKRSLEYIPTVEQLGKEFPISFQVTTAGGPASGPAPPEISGIACGTVVGRCSTELTPDFTLTHTVRVLPFRTAFVDPPAPPLDPRPLLDPATGAETGQVSVAPPGPDSLAVYVNCPMQSFGVTAFAAVGRELDATAAGALSKSRPVHFSIVEDEDEEQSLAELGLTLAPTTMYTGSEQVICEGGGDAYCASDTNFYHTAVSWTPQLEMMGRSRRLCVRAETSTFAAEKCFVLEVQRCLYCTQPSDTLHSVAARFHTNWLQLWSANFQGDPVLNPHEVNPNAIAAGTLLRLGPVYQLRLPEDLAHILHEFQTSEAAIRRTNRDLAPDATVIPAQSLCVLPGICTQEDEWM